MTEARKKLAETKDVPAVFFNEKSCSEIKSHSNRTKFCRLAGSIVGRILTPNPIRSDIQIVYVQPNGKIAIHQISLRHEVLALAPCPHPLINNRFVSLSTGELIIWQYNERTNQSRRAGGFSLLFQHKNVHQFKCLSLDGRFYGAIMSNDLGNHYFLLFDILKQTIKQMKYCMSFGVSTDKEFYSIVTLDDGFWLTNSRLINDDVITTKCFPLENINDNCKLFVWPQENMLIVMDAVNKSSQLLCLSGGQPLYFSDKKIPFIKNPFFFADCLYFCNEDNCLSLYVPQAKKTLTPGLYQTKIPFPEGEDVILLDNNLVAEFTSDDDSPICKANIHRLAIVDPKAAQLTDALQQFIPPPIISLVAGYARFSIWSDNDRLLEHKPIELTFPTHEEQLSKLISDKIRKLKKNSAHTNPSLDALIHFETALRNNSKKEGFTYKKCLEMVTKSFNIELTNLDEETQAFFHSISLSCMTISKRHGQ